MSDRELLELAAKAAGIGPVLCYETRRNCLRIGYRDSYTLWRPLIDDADAFRLAVVTNQEILIAAPLSYARIALLEGASAPIVEGHSRSNAYTATRRCIVRAAAEIGRQMP